MRTPEKLKKRAITSVVLITALALITLGDAQFDRYVPFLSLVLLAAVFFTARELDDLAQHGNDHEETFFIVAVIPLAYFWYKHVGASPGVIHTAETMTIYVQTIWIMAACVFGLAVVEMKEFWEHHDCSRRLFQRAFILGYLTLPACVLLEMRWNRDWGGAKIVIATFLVPKLGDVAAYLVGSLVGKHRMTPTLSPKKTWEGFAGGMVVSVFTAIIINEIGEPLFKHGVLQAAAFGLVVGLAGVFGDLFESMIKRDAQTKDASSTVPGFGGVLDVVDSILFAAPAAYVFLVLWP